MSCLKLCIYTQMALAHQRHPASPAIYTLCLSNTCRTHKKLNLTGIKFNDMHLGPD